MSETNDTEDFQLLRLRRRTPIAEDTYLLELVHPEGKLLAPFEAGAHISLKTPGGELRDYSLSNDPAERHHYVLAIKQEPWRSGSSSSIIEQIQEGDLISVSLPKNNFPLQPAEEYLFIAGGIGITPIISMMRHLKRSGMHNFRLIYCTRTPEATAFLEELTSPEFVAHVTLHHDRGDPENIFDLQSLLARPGRAHVYSCGPQNMLKAVRDLSKHWPREMIHMEDFSENG